MKPSEIIKAIKAELLKKLDNKNNRYQFNVESAQDNIKECRLRYIDKHYDFDIFISYMLNHVKVVTRKCFFEDFALFTAPLYGLKDDSICPKIEQIAEWIAESLIAHAAYIND